MAVDTKELRALLAKMTPGEWVAAPYSSMVGAPIVASPSGRPVAKVTYFHLGPEFDNHNRESAANAAGIVALVNAAEPMLDEIERLRHALQRMIDTGDDACDPAWVKRIARAALGEQP